VPGIEEAIAELLAAPLEVFVAERKRLAAELRAAGDREGAAELAKYPKPSAPAWALNDVARTQPGAVRAWLDAAEALRAATAAPGPGLRDAMAAHRRQTSALLDVVRRTARPNGKPLTGPMLERVRALLADATADPGAADALRTATLSEGARTGSDPFLARPCDAPHEPDEPPRDDAAERAAAEARAELERQVGAAYAAVSTATEELAERKAAASAAAERLEEAQRTLHRRESEARAAEDAARDARDAVTEAEDAAKALVEQLRRAG
jgi:hypothetical protein